MNQNKAPNEQPAPSSRTKLLKLALIIVIIIGLTSVIDRYLITTNANGPIRPAQVITLPQDDTVKTVVAVGDIACSPKSKYFNDGNGDGEHCQMTATANLVSQIKPSSLLLLGDNQYENGEYNDYLASFDKSWGQFKNITHPAPGNHEYNSAGAAGYYQYFGLSAGDPKKGYYSFDHGNWHIVALNSNCKYTGGCGTASEEYKWLQNDLSQHSNTCTLAYYHHPRYSSGEHGNNDEMSDIWSLLNQGRVDLVLNGHDHTYERFKPQNSKGEEDYINGVREFVVGSGGKDHYDFKDVKANSEVRDNTDFGVLKLSLSKNAYGWSFVSTNPNTSFHDDGEASCH